MRKRNVHVQFWLDKKEAEAFNKKVKRSGLSREAYLRHLVNGLVPQDAPPPAYYDFIDVYKRQEYVPRSGISKYCPICAKKIQREKSNESKRRSRERNRQACIELSAKNDRLTCSSGWGVSSARAMKTRRWKSIGM